MSLRVLKKSFDWKKGSDEDKWTSVMGPVSALTLRWVTTTRGPAAELVLTASCRDAFLWHDFLQEDELENNKLKN
jgi:hypothetical protein